MRKKFKTNKIQIRISKQQKAELKSKAQNLGISVSDYILRCTEQCKINMVDTKELAKEIFELNQHLSDLERCPVIPTRELRDTISEQIKKLNGKLEENNVNPKI